MNVPFMYDFQSLSSKFPTIFWSLIFHIYYPGYTIFVRKRKPKIFGALERVMEGGIRKILTFVKY